MSESILQSVKKSLGINPENVEFDTEITMHINSVINVLNQLGLRSVEGFQIEDQSTTWGDYLRNDKRLNLVKTYMYAKVRLIFDPPQMSSVIECLKETVREFEFRIQCEVDPTDTFGGDKYE